MIEVFETLARSEIFGSQVEIESSEIIRKL